MSDTSDEGSRLQRIDLGVHRLEKILSKHGGEPHQSDVVPRRTTSDEGVAEQSPLTGASVSDVSKDSGRDPV